ncbi:CAA Xprenyl protease [Schizosaccharomyces japonicus yFS275]|uniref:CAAX prenyl protease n=1 Tax=Schizosaccharomyces japonicus (strain yFS275 / FY16936) TaxID=402676 RepID=B6K444_SCHJY|nr:CAA Xprenyl protease [Schizosaccharomyces japonicus yFS275]EEB08251.2 CAA Xprenyl protease [Schizosaccharomyces japonicus yFS275]
MGIFDFLSHAFDIPAFPWKSVVLAFTISRFLWERYLSKRQYKHYLNEKPPAVLASVVDEKKYKRAMQYARTKAHFGVLSSSFSFIISILIIRYNGFARLWNATDYSWMDRLATSNHWWSVSKAITHSCMFAFAGSVFSTIIDTPFSLYSTFVIEEKFGFNKTTMRTFWADIVKGLALGGVLLSIIIAIFLKVIIAFGDNFVVYVWVSFIVLGMVLQTIAPYVILPLFNKFTPVTDPELKSKIEELAASVKFPLKNLYIMDASRRSGHSNAFFYGMPWSKGIVLYDTLVKNQTTTELLAVLGHELGHWYMWHILIQQLVNYAVSFFHLALFAGFIRNNSMYSAFGFSGEHPILIGYLLFTSLFEPLSALISFGNNLLSRSCEYQADAFAKRLGYGDALAEGLIRLHEDNMSPLDFDRWFSAYHHNHPPLLERLEAIGYGAQTTDKTQ